ncbi:T-cell surface glycoprotein CD3 epsilon chain-like [Anguilla anguilla]|uniref:T-cell surface glycoprotein CD3 epsilon chain-like n=1 Tax=Anguilla anguilla TaxID=7936 RepID=UPI0015A8B25F|nr:T-cell surface glycoprotein CD3 epsilon chain-like [Anguilla anguilla]
MIKAAFVFVLALAVVECSGDKGSVEFSGMDFIMTCPNSDGGTPWSSDYNPEGNKVTLSYKEGGKKKHSCTIDSDKTYNFYVQGRVCKNCYELDGGLLIGIIFVDLLVTGGVIIVIYNCAQRKSSSARSPAPASGRPVRANAPSVPDRDYEPLNHATRDTATYAVAGVNRTG